MVRHRLNFMTAYGSRVAKTGKLGPLEGNHFSRFQVHICFTVPMNVSKSLGGIASWKSGIEAAREIIGGFVRKTPLEYSHWLSSKYGSTVYFKMECDQVTGSFKARGAFNKIFKHVDKLRNGNGPIISSSGNHGLACIHAFLGLQIQGTIVVPYTISPTKEEKLLQQGASLCHYGNDCVVTENFVRQEAMTTGRVYISSYNDVDVICGQGTIGVEIFEDLPHVDVVFVAVGGGGSIAGISAYLKACRPNVTVIGCQPKQSKVMYESVKAGKIVKEEAGETLSDGTAGGVEDGAITLEMCCNYVDDWALLSEEEIEKAVYFMLEKHHKVIEGAAGVALAGYLQTAARYRDQKVVIVLCGSNIAVDKLRYIVNKWSDCV